MLLSNTALNNRTSIWVLVFLICLMGGLSYVQLPRESSPDIPLPYVMVTTRYEGVSPADIETAVTMKIEKKLTGLKGLKEMSSVSSEGLSVITLEFQTDVEIDDAMQYARDKIDLAKGDLPKDADEPILTEINFAEMPIMFLNISGDISPVRLKKMAEELQDLIEADSRVLEVVLVGELEREIRLEFDPDRLAAYEISVPELIGLVPGENVNVSAGGLETPGTKFNIRVPAEFNDPADISSLLLTYRDGKPIYLNDVAIVHDTFKDRISYSRLDGKPTITLQVKKRIGSNIMEIATRVKAIVAEARKQLPTGVELEITMDQSDDVVMMVSDLENNILSGLILVVAVLMLFLGLRTSFIVGMAIPLSMLMSFAILQAMGITLNMIVLFSLILALGMLVDNAIVIVENIFRFMQEGFGKLEAAKRGAAEVAWPVIASTATTLAAFAPMLAWDGVMGEFMKYLPKTLIIVLSSSLFVALIINPVIATVFASAKRKVDKHKSHKFTESYVNILRWCVTSISHRIATLLIAAILLVSITIVYGKFNFGMELFPSPDPKRASIVLQFPQGTNVSHTDKAARQVEQRIFHLVESGEIKHIVSNIGGETQKTLEGDTGPHIADITLVFKDYADRTISSNKHLTTLREQLNDIPGAEVRIKKQDEGPPTGAPITVRISGDDFDTLAQIAQKAENLIRPVAGVVDLRNDYDSTRPELQFKPDRQRAIMLGINTDTIGNFLKTAVFGSEVSIYRQFNDEYDITVRLPLDNRREVAEIYRLTIPNKDGKPIPLSSLGHFEYRGGKGTITRLDNRRTITVTADVDGRSSDDALKEVQQLLAKELQLPTGYYIEYAGENEENQKAQQFLSWAFMVALLSILLILVMQFNTLGVPFIILMTVLLSLIGVFIGLMVTATPFGLIMTGIGVISLAGVVVNNAIVLLDYTRQLEQQGMNIVDAAIQAGKTRLRPVLLTAVTTILGLIPMATGIAFDFRNFEWVTKSESSIWWASMANAVIFGLGFATILTLIVVPTMYTAIYSLLEHLGLGGLKAQKTDK